MGPEGEVKAGRWWSVAADDGLLLLQWLSAPLQLSHAMLCAVTSCSPCTPPPKKSKQVW